LRSGLYRVRDAVRALVFDNMLDEDQRHVSVGRPPEPLPRTGLV
jgi:hypothetical protein